MAKGKTALGDFDDAPASIERPVLRTVIYGTQAKDQKGLSDFEENRLDGAKLEPIEESDEQSYPRYRRWHWRFVFGWPGFMGLGAVIGMISDRFPIAPIAIPLTVGFLVCLVGGLICWLGLLYTSFTLKYFRCPRCGKRFAVSWGVIWPCKTCDHCDLYLG